MVKTAWQSGAAALLLAGSVGSNSGGGQCLDRITRVAGEGVDGYLYFGHWEKGLEDLRCPGATSEYEFGAWNGGFFSVE